MTSLPYLKQIFHFLKECIILRKCCIKVIKLIMILKLTLYLFKSNLALSYS